MATANVTKKTAELMAPARALNELALANAERLMDMQLSNTRKYAGIMLDGLKEAATVQDAESAKKYLAGRMEVARSTTESLRSDTEELMKLGQDYMTEVQKIMKTSLADLPKLGA